MKFKRQRSITPNLPFFGKLLQQESKEDNVDEAEAEFYAFTNGSPAKCGYKSLRYSTLPQSAGNGTSLCSSLRAIARASNKLNRHTTPKRACILDKFLNSLKRLVQLFQK